MELDAAGMKTETPFLGSTDTTTALPRRVFRQEAVYRTPAGREVGVHGCGFVVKPTSVGSYLQRRMVDYVAVYVVRGSGTFVDSTGVATRVDAGDFIQMPAGLPHSVVQDPNGQWAECWLTLDGRFCEELGRLGSIDLSRQVIRPGVDMELIERFERILADLTHAPDTALAHTLARAHDLLSYAHELDHRRRAPHPHADMIDSACAALGRDLAKRLDVAALAAAQGLSYERFRKVFRARVGVSPGEYRIRRRIDRARVLIAQERMTNAQAAYALGYPDPFSFSKQFKQVVGVSPNTFRRTV
jgi:AraC family transcriptional regulator of arabinose operon